MDQEEGQPIQRVSRDMAAANERCMLIAFNCFSDFIYERYDYILQNIDKRFLIHLSIGALFQLVPCQVLRPEL